MSRTRLALASLAMAGVLGGCGVPLQGSAEALPAGVVAVPTDPTPVASATPEAPAPAPAVTIVSPARLWFVRDDGLVAVSSTLPAGTEKATLLEALATGPSDTSTAMRTVATDPLTGDALVELVEAAPTNDPQSPNVVRIKAAFASLPPAEQVLLLGQVVLTLTGAGAPSVQFVDETGALLAVPLPSGRLQDAPATARDYASLIIQP